MTAGAAEETLRAVIGRGRYRIDLSDRTSCSSYL